MTRLRDSITKDQTRQKNRIKSHLRYLGIEIPQEYIERGRRWSKSFVVWLRNVESTCEYGRLMLDQLICQYEDLRKRRLELIRLLRKLSRTERFVESLKWLRSVSGIGQLTGMTFISEIDDISRFKNAYRLASYLGIIPMCHSSGEHDSTGDITLRSHSKLRCVLIETT